MNTDQHEWIIQDGNYPDFTTGQHAEFALESYPQNIRSSESKTKSTGHLGAAKYEIKAEIVYLTPEVWVLDFGICAFQESTPPKETSVANL